MKPRQFIKKAEKKLNAPQKGLELKPADNKTDHEYYDIIYKGVFVRQLKVSRGGDWGTPRINQVAHNLGISQTAVMGIVSCLFDTDDFIEKSRILTGI